MQNVRLAQVCAVAAVLLAISGCRSNQGFTIVTKEVVQPQGLTGMTFPLVETPVEGQYVANGGGSPGGSVESYDGVTLGDANDPTAEGTYYVSDAIAPAYWNHEVWFPSYCLYPESPAYFKGTTFGGSNEFEDDEVWMDNLGAFEWDCLTPPSQIPPASSRFAIAGSVPSSVTLTGLNPFTTQYGLPIMYVFDGTNGTPNLYTTITALSVDPSGSSATFSLPSSLPQNAYAFETVNQTSAGGYTPNSFNLYSVAGSQTIAGNPFGVAAGGLTVTVETCIEQVIGGRHIQKCVSSSKYNPLAVVSLYSQNQVLIGTTPVTVGSNPTAVSVYPAPSETERTEETTESGTVTTTTSSSERAVVANSGSNSIDILDLVYGSVLSTITVGNEPVALAVSSDGSYAYVANYADSTVTQVNLNTDSATATVAVGGKPASVALASSGNLWVGGVGFITEINTQTMSVAATQSTNGETIAALGFGDALNELVTTTVDASGAVSIDEIGPSSVQSGTTYTPLASHTVSALGTYTIPETQTQVRGFTATVTTAAPPVLINTDQPGAPPIVVQDGWAVVTATPTGFSITDLSGHIVLVSETTPSPIAAIAVDQNLNVAYLTMPDSNTLLTVPLPGTGSN